MTAKSTHRRKQDDAQYSEGDAVQWTWDGATVVGVVEGVHEQYSPPGTDQTITGEDDEAVYSIREYDPETGQYEDTINVGKPESSLNAADRDLPERSEENTKDEAIEEQPRDEHGRFAPTPDDPEGARAAMESFEGSQLAEDIDEDMNTAEFRDDNAGFTLDPNFTRTDDEGWIATISNDQIGADEEWDSSEQIVDQLDGYEEVIAEHRDIVKIGGYIGKDGHKHIDFNVFTGDDGDAARAIGEEFDQESIFNSETWDTEELGGDGLDEFLPPDELNERLEAVREEHGIAKVLIKQNGEGEGAVMAPDRVFVGEETGRRANNYAIGRSVVRGEVEVIETDEDGNPLVIDPGDGRERLVAMDVDDEDGDEGEGDDDADRNVESFADSETMSDGTTKVGRTLSGSNVRRAKLQHDVAEQMLQAEGITAHGPHCRTYDEDKTDRFALDDAIGKVAYDPAAEAAKAVGEDEVAGLLEDVRMSLLDALEGYLGGETDVDPDAHMDEIGGRVTSVIESVHDDVTGDDEEEGTADGDDQDSDDGETTERAMTDDETPEVVEDLLDKLNSIEDRLDAVEKAETCDDEEDEDEDEAEMADEDYEEEKSEPPEWAEKMADRVDDLSTRVDKLSKATAGTQQAGGTDNRDEKSETEKRKEAIFVPSSQR